MVRKFFNFGLYRDMLRQLRTMGIVFGVLCIVASVLPVLISFTTGYNVPSIAQATPALLVFMYIGGLTFVLAAFSFLHKRASSDFYHSLPDSRVCTYTSILAAVLTWVYAIIISTILLTWLSYVAFGLPFNHSYIPWLLAVYLAGTTFVVGGSLIAVGVTGTLLSNIIVAGLVIFLPRFILLFYTAAAIGTAQIVGAHELGLFFDPATNLPTAFIFNLFTVDVGSMSDLFFNTGGLIYTAVLGVLYLALGGLLFRFRRSELAGSSAPNRVLQHVYRCAITLPFVMVLFNHYIGYSRMAGADISDAVSIIIFVISLAVYFVFEIVTTRKAKNLLRAAPWYLAVVAAAVLLSLAAHATGDAMLNTKPSAEEIKYVSIGADRGEFIGAARTVSYTRLLTDKIRYEEPEIKKMLSEGLEKTIELHTTGTDVYIGADNHGGAFGLALTDGRQISRVIILAQSGWDRLHALQLQNVAYQEAYRSLPRDTEISAINLPRLDEAAARQVWQTFRQEVQGLSDVDYDKIVEGGSAGLVPEAQTDGSGLTGANRVLELLTVVGSVGLENYTSTYYLTDLTPRALDMYMHLVTTQVSAGFAKEADNVLGGSFTRDSVDHYDFCIRLYNMAGEGKDGSYFDDHQPVYEEDAYYKDAGGRAAVTNKILQIIRSEPLRAGNLSKPLALITLYSNFPGRVSEFQDTIYLELSDDQLRAILNAIGPYMAIP